MTLEIKCLSENAKLPTRATDFAAGYDLYSAQSITLIPPRERSLIKTNIAIKIPNGYYGRIAPRSGLALKNGIDIGGGVVDSDYRGDVGVIMFNCSDVPFYVNLHDKIAQLIITPYLSLPIEEVGELDKTDRGEGGFGSTGTK